MVRGKAESFHTQLASKQYRDAVREVLRTTAVRPSDLDGKALALLDALQQHGRAREACLYLKQALEGLPRDRISNWRAYAYTLLRGFDEAAYEAMKADRTTQRRRRPRVAQSAPAQSLNERAAEFVPGQPWPPLQQVTTEPVPGRSEGPPALTEQLGLHVAPAVQPRPAAASCRASVSDADAAAAAPEASTAEVPRPPAVLLQHEVPVKEEQLVARVPAEATNAEAANAQATPRWGLALLAATAVLVVASLAWARRRH